ncbi:ATG16 autophagy related 16-like 2 isoform X2 [Scleropages formosus]|uniref:ATG16 autophagy related 16-like 2 isoform X2 n=1 Tax=Scleropages formosus TaxID=113540 RepID=UPI0010FA6C54|nr:autophagy-related protein 16-2-like isoform X2 [Scleropages formosus]
MAAREQLDSAGAKGSPADAWKHHIIRQLKHRDRAQKTLYQDLIRSYIKLLEKSNQKVFIAQGLLGSVARHQLSTSKDSLTSLVSQHQDKVKNLNKTSGELAYKVLELQQEIRIKSSVLEEQHARMSEIRSQLAAAEAEVSGLQAQVEEVRQGNWHLKREYDSLLERHHDMDEKFREEKVRGSELVEDMIRWKQLAAVKMNTRNEKRVRAREANIQKELEMAAKEKVDIDIGSCNMPSVNLPSPKPEVDEKSEKRQTRMFRSASAAPPRIFDSFKDFFEKRRGNSLCSLEEDLYAPLRVCLAARIPCRAIHVLDAHELSINAVRFSSISNLLATGGTDRVIKLWDISAGMLQNRGILDGSNEGITSIEFDPTGTKLLAASYDKSALFWRLDDSRPKFTLTGHSRKVTAAKFKCSLRQVVTGSADRTVKVWDLHRAACIQTIEVFSYCSDVVCSEYFIISGHYDRKIRFWDSRAASCTQEIPLQGRVTSMDLCPDHRQLLSCSRDESLQVVDLRMSNSRRSFRADGFKCGCDTTKAIFSPDGSYLAAGSADGAVYIWNVNTGHLETTLPDKHRWSSFIIQPHGVDPFVDLRRDPLLKMCRRHRRRGPTEITHPEGLRAS